MRGMHTWVHCNLGSLYSVGSVTSFQPASLLQSSVIEYSPAYASGVSQLSRVPSPGFLDWAAGSHFAELIATRTHGCFCTHMA